MKRLNSVFPAFPFLVLTSLSAIGCGSGSSDVVGVDEAALSRWPDKGSYSYDSTEGSCATGKHEFGRKAEYCVSLTNEDLNHGCALESRKRNYADSCGSDFAPTQLYPIRVTGGDS